MTDVVVTPVTSGYNINRINNNFDLLATTVNDELIHSVGGNNVMSQDLDMNGFDLLNISTDFSNDDSLLTVGDAKANFYRVGLVPTATDDGDAINYGQVSQIVAGAEIGEIPSNIALKSDVINSSNDLLATLASSNGSSLIGHLGGTVKSFLQGLATSIGATLIGYQASWTGAVLRTLGQAAEDQINSEWWSPDRTGSISASAKLQLALDAAAGKTLTIRPGIYLLDASLKISSNTTVIAYGCTFNRSGTLDNLIRNNADGVTGGYQANRNINIFGGTWVSTTGTGTCTVFGFGHATNVTIRDCTIYNENEWHHIEINGCNNARVINCNFYGGYVTASDGNESIQIDGAYGSSVFPWFGPYDNTVCNTVLVDGCYFSEVGTGVGTHSSTPIINHNNIRVSNSHFTDVHYAGVITRDWSDVAIVNNKMEGCAYGVILGTASRNQSDILVSGNVIYNIGNGTRTGDARGIMATKNGAANVTNCRIVNNTVTGVTGPTATHGISVDGGFQSVVTGNTVSGCRGAGIYMFGASSASVSNNQCQGNNSAGIYQDIRIGYTGVNADSTRLTVIANGCGTMGISTVQNSFVTANNCFTSLTATSNTNTTVVNNFVGITYA